MMDGVFNHSICIQCGGRCCKRMAGATTPDDWDNPIEQSILEGLRSARWIVAKAPNSLLYVMPRMTLRGCVFLQSDGCSLSDKERPSACRTLVPRMDFNCVSKKGEHVNDFANLWKPYQRLLAELDNETHQPIRRPKGIWGRAIL